MTRRPTPGRIAMLVPLLVASRALAEGSPRVALDLDPCVRADGASKLLAIELDATLTDPAPDVTTIRVRCTESASTAAGPVVEIAVDDPITRKMVQRRVDLSTYPEGARARAVAIAAAELVSASWAEAALQPAPRVEPAGPPPPAADRAAVVARMPTPPPAAIPSPPARPSHVVSAGVLGRSVIGEVGQVGGTIRYEIDLGKPERFGFGIGLDGAAAEGRAQSSVGKVSASTFDGAAGFYARVPVGRRVTLRAGPGLRLGYGTLTGHATDSSSTEVGSVDSAFTAPHVALGGRLRLGDAFTLGANVELGALLGGPRGHVVSDRPKTIALTGAYLAPSITAGASF